MTLFLRRTAILLIALLGAAACRSGPEPVAKPSRDAVVAAAFDAQAYERLGRQDGRVFWIESGASEVRLFLWRGGRLASEGHNHVLAVRKMEGAVFLPADMLAGTARFDIAFHAEDIEVDSPALRRQIGGAFAAPIKPGGIRGTRENMLGGKVLDADRFPRIAIHAARIYGELPKVVVEAQVTLHGAARRRLVPATVTVEGDRLRATGAFAIRQTAFGIEPITAMGGALYVHDPMMIEFDLHAQSR